MLKIRRKIKRLLSLCLTVLIVCISVIPCLGAVSYPANVTKDSSLATIEKADKAIYNFLQMQNTSLKDIVLPELYSDEILSDILVEIYRMVEAEAGSTLTAVGINTSVSNVAKEISRYPSVSEKLKAYSSWADVDLTGASWGVTTKSDFAVALATMFAPFNEVLYALLCNGSYSLNLLVGIKGSNGYETAIIPTLKALGCRDITPAETFYSDAEADKGKMVYNMVYDILTFAEQALDAPCDTLSSSLPSIANYFVNGGFDNAVATLVAPLKLQVLNISTIIPIESLTAFISDTESYTQNFTLNFNDILASTGMPMAQIDLELLATLGTINEDGTVTADKADTFIVLLRWIIDTLKLNQSSLGEFLPDADAQTMEMIAGILSKETDELISLLISLFNQTGAALNDYQWTFKDFAAGAVTYTPNLTAEKYQRVADNVDELLDDVVAEMGEEKSLSNLLKKEIYSSKTLTSLIKGIYSALEGEDMAMIASLLGIDVSPKGVADVISAKGHSDEAKALYAYSKWSDIGENSLDWGIKAGSKKQFVSILASAFAPLNNILGMLLAEDKIVLFDAVEIYGSNGYNTAIIPIYEALGCEASTIKTHEEFKTLYARGKGVEALLDPIVSLIDRIIDKPVYTVLQILPNLLYFLDGSLTTCIDNLLYPFKGILAQLGMENAIDLSALENLDINQFITEMMSSADLGITLPAIDVDYIGSLGTAVQMTSKRTVAGQFATVTYIQSDMPALCVTLLRILAQTLKSPENSSLIDTLMATGTGAQPGSDAAAGTNDMVAVFAEGIVADINAMTVDETAEWLYKLFFRERATVQMTDDGEEYMPTIIFKPKTNYTFVLVIFAVLILIPVGVIAGNKIKMKRREEMLSESNQEV